MNHTPRPGEVVIVSAVRTPVGRLQGSLASVPVASLLATPLRYYSPAFLRLTAGIIYGPTVTPLEELLRQQIKARHARPPTLWGYASQLIAGLG
jgi:hypothetical protein